MSITSVNAKIRTAVKDAFVTTAEAKAIVKEAEKGRLTVGEEKAVVALFDKQPRTPPPGMMVTMAIPENPGDVQLEAGAKNVLETFFAKHDVPAGKTAAKYLDAVKAVLASGVDQPALDAPPDVKKLHRVSIPSPPGLMDGPVKAAFIDTKKNEFYLSLSSMFRPAGAPMTRWYGPMSLEKAEAPASDKVSAKRADEIRSAFMKANTAGTLGWQQGLPTDRLGVRYETVELMRERHPDGFAYTAYIPVGALSPTAPKADPNKVTEVYVSRVGGIAGFRQNVKLEIPLGTSVGGV